MAHIICDPCRGCLDTACVEVCPADCILSSRPLEELRGVALADRPGRFPGVGLFIDPELCIDCGLCVAECPVAAIYPEEEVPAEWSAAIAGNAASAQASGQ